MNIQKGKVLKNCEWSASTQKRLASMLGVSAMLSLSGAALTACDLGSNTTSGAVSGPEVSSSSEDLPPESGVVEPPEPTCGEMPCDGQEPPSSSSVQPNSSSSGPVSGISSSSFDYPPLAGILPPSSSSNAIDTWQVTSGEIAPPDTLEPESGSPFDQSSSSSGPEYPPLGGIVMLPESSSSSEKVESSSSEEEYVTAGLPVIEESSSSANEIDSTLTAGLPVLSSSSEPEPLPGDPIELPPEPLSGDVADPDPIYIDDPKD